MICCARDSIRRSAKNPKADYQSINRLRATGTVAFLVGGEEKLSTDDDGKATLEEEQRKRSIFESRRDAIKDIEPTEASILVSSTAPVGNGENQRPPSVLTRFAHACPAQSSRRGNPGFSQHQLSCRSGCPVTPLSL